MYHHHPKPFMIVTGAWLLFLLFFSSELRSQDAAQCCFPETGSGISGRIRDFDVVLGHLGRDLQPEPATPTPVPPSTSATRPPPGSLGGYIAFQRPSAAGDTSDIYTIRADGEHLRRLTTDGRSTRPGWSPDGRQIVFTSTRNGNADIYRMNADGTNQTRLTTDPDVDQQPVWSPTGDRIAFLASRASDSGDALFVMNTDGTDQVPLSPFNGDTAPAVWSPDGTQLAFWLARSDSTPPDPEGIYTVAVDGTNLHWHGPGFNPTWHPNGSWLTFKVQRTGEIGVKTINTNTGEQIGFFDIGAITPAWSPDGTRLAFPATLDASGELPFPESDIYTGRFDGSDIQRVTNGGFYRLDPVWAPEGTRLAFIQNQSIVLYNPTIGLVNSDGTGLTVLTAGHSPVWQPVPPAPPRGAAFLPWVVASGDAPPMAIQIMGRSAPRALR